MKKMIVFLIIVYIFFTGKIFLECSSLDIQYVIPEYKGYLINPKLPYKVAIYFNKMSPDLDLDITIWKTPYTKSDYYTSPIGQVLIKKTTEALTGSFKETVRTKIDSVNGRQEFLSSNNFDYIVEIKILNFDHYWKGYPDKKFVMGQTFYPVAKIELEMIIKKKDGSTILSSTKKYESKEITWKDLTSKKELEKQLIGICDQTSEVVEGAISLILQEVKL